MRNAHVEIARIDPLRIDDLVEAQNEIFSDYVIPMRSSKVFFLEFLRTVGGQLKDVLVARVDDRIVGYVNPVVDGAEAWIGGVGVVPAMRRRGVARTLMRAAEESAAERGAETIILEVIEGNLGALRLYEREGYTKSGCYISAEGKPMHFAGFGEFPERVSAEDVADIHSMTYADHCWQRRKRSSLFEAGKGSETYAAEGGFVMLRRAGTTGFVTFLGVRPDLRRRGIGTSLGKFALNRLWEMGVYKVAVYNAKEDLATSRMFDKFDFAVTLRQLEMRKGLSARPSRGP